MNRVIIISFIFCISYLISCIDDPSNMNWKQINHQNDNNNNDSCTDNHCINNSDATNNAVVTNNTTDVNSDQANHSVVCETPNTICDEQCIDITTDKNHCGACNTKCPGYCSDSTCHTVTSITAGPSNICAVLTDKSAWCWGSGNFGQLGNGELESFSLSPTPVIDLPPATAITVGDYHACAILEEDGAVACWGWGEFGQLGHGIIESSATPVYVRPPDGDGLLTGVMQISAGGAHTCAVLTDSRAVCWGSNSAYELGTSENIAWSEKPVYVDHFDTQAPLQGVVKISAAGEHNCAMLLNNQAMCWGDGFFGKLGHGSGSSMQYPAYVVASDDNTEPLNDVVDISAGALLSCALLSSGEPRCWGSNVNGRLGNNGSISSYVPTNLAPSFLAQKISVGYYHSCAIDIAGGIRCWGDSPGNGLDQDSRVPKSLTNLESWNFVEITAGSSQTCAITSEGGAFCWGAGPLGNGVSSQSITPVEVSF